MGTIPFSTEKTHDYGRGREKISSNQQFREVVDQEDSPCPYTGAGASWKNDVFRCPRGGWKMGGTSLGGWALGG